MAGQENGFRAAVLRKLEEMVREDPVGRVRIMITAEMPRGEVLRHVRENTVIGACLVEKWEQAGIDHVLAASIKEDADDASPPAPGT